MRVISISPICLSILAALALGACGSQTTQSNSEPVEPAQSKATKVLVPADRFDLTQWKITVPLDADDNGKIDEVNVKELQTYQHSDFFYLNEDGHMVFATPNKAMTTANSSNTRSELRHMLGGGNTKTKVPANNFSVESHKRSSTFAQVGGKLQATVKVNHVAKRANYPEKYPAYSVVVGQIHADKDKKVVAQNEGYGWGNEPLKIYYKKWPNHEYGSVFWNYERNLEKENPLRKDISYPVWGNDWGDKLDPSTSGIALDEAFSYEVNVYKDTMYLTFTTVRHGTVKFSINLIDKVDAYGNTDSDDHPNGYTGDALYFKAGAYNQCSIKDDPGFWFPYCSGTGDWETDKKNGDYTQVTFTHLETGKGYKPK